VSLRESCMREIRTYSLSGGRWPARKRATSDPTVMKRSNVRGAKRAGHSRRTMLVNWQQEEPTDRRDDGRQLLMIDKSRVSREAQARFRDGLGVKLPGATRPTSGA
jgi:hypothetical protein